MNKLSLIIAMLPLLIATACSAQTEPSAETAQPSEANKPLKRPSAAANAPTGPATISIQEMLVSGPTQLKLHSLAMIAQGNVTGEIDSSYLPGLKACSEDPALPLRSVTAQILGQHFVQNKETPNPKAVTMLKKLAQDDESYVRYNAVYYGLSQIQNKSDDIISLLIDVASENRENDLVNRIAESLQADQNRVAKIMDKKLQTGDNVEVFEIYKDLAGKKPANTEKYLDMPSSRPHLFIFNISGSDPEASKTELLKQLKSIGIENPNLTVSGTGENAVLLLKTYITKDYLAVEKEFESNPEFKIAQAMWLTPEMEAQIQKMKK